MLYILHVQCFACRLLFDIHIFVTHCILYESCVGCNAKNSHASIFMNIKQCFMQRGIVCAFIHAYSCVLMLLAYISQ